MYIKILVTQFKRCGFMRDNSNIFNAMICYDWFIFSKNGRFLVVPVHIEKDNNLWSILPYDDGNKQELAIPDYLYGKSYYIQKDNYIKNYYISIDFEKAGFKPCGLCHGKVIEEKHPVISRLLNNDGIDTMDDCKKMWVLATAYSNKIAEQYQAFLDNKRSKQQDNEVYMDRYGLPYKVVR